MSALVVAVANVKGGTSKTTSAAYLAHVLHEQGRRVLVVDADPQRSILTWAELAEWGPAIATIGMPSSRIHRELPAIVDGRFDAVVIDTPPGERDRAVVESAIRAASHVVVPCAPTPVEHERLRVLWPVIEDAAAAVDVPAEVAVLLVRTVAGAASTIAYREVIAEDGWRVLRAAVGRRERFAMAFGDPIVRATQTSYGDAVAEMIDGKVATA